MTHLDNVRTSTLHCRSSVPGIGPIRSGASGDLLVNDARCLSRSDMDGLQTFQRTPQVTCAAAGSSAKCGGCSAWLCLQSALPNCAGDLSARGTGLPPVRSIADALPSFGRDVADGLTLVPEPTAPLSLRYWSRYKANAYRGASLDYIDTSIVYRVVYGARDFDQI